MGAANSLRSGEQYVAGTPALRARGSDLFFLAACLATCLLASFLSCIMSFCGRTERATLYICTWGMAWHGMERPSWLRCLFSLLSSSYLVLPYCSAS